MWGKLLCLVCTLVIRSNYFAHFSVLGVWPWHYTRRPRHILLEGRYIVLYISSYLRTHQCNHRVRLQSSLQPTKRGSSTTPYLFVTGGPSSSRVVMVWSSCLSHHHLPPVSWCHYDLSMPAYSTVSLLPRNSLWKYKCHLAPFSSFGLIQTTFIRMVNCFKDCFATSFVSCDRFSWLEFGSKLVRTN